jgi:hypothetical protein
MTYRVKSWGDFQHFKDRTPPWIKLYRDILNDPDWHDLSGDDAKSLVMIWLMASEDKSGAGIVPDQRTLGFRLRISETEATALLDRLSSHWLIRDDNTPISPRHHRDNKVTSRRHHRDAPETERETESESESEVETDSGQVRV